MSKTYEWNGHQFSSQEELEEYREDYEAAVISTQEDCQQTWYSHKPSDRDFLQKLKKFFRNG